MLAKKQFQFRFESCSDNENVEHSKTEPSELQPTHARTQKMMTAQAKEMAQHDTRRSKISDFHLSQVPLCKTRVTNNFEMLQRSDQDGKNEA